MHRSNVINVLSSIKVYPLTFFPHYIHPNNTLFLNGIDDSHPDNDDDYVGGGGDEETFIPTLGIRSTYPIKLKLPTDINSIVQHNIVLKLVQQKNDFINDMEKLIGNYKRASQYHHTEFTFYDLFIEIDLMKMGFLRISTQRLQHRKNPKITYTVCISIV